MGSGDKKVKENVLETIHSYVEDEKLHTVFGVESRGTQT